MSNEEQNGLNDEDTGSASTVESDTSIVATEHSKQPKTGHSKCDKTTHKNFKTKSRKTVERNDKPIKKFSWKRMVPHLPSWLKTNPIVAITGTPGSTSKPSHSSKKSRSWKRSSLQCIQHGICTKCSHERVLSCYDFDNAISAPKTAYQRWTEKGMSVWAKLIKLGISESDQETKTNTSDQPGSWKPNTNKQVLKASLIKLSLNDKSCKSCKKKKLGPSSTCQEILVKQTWAYLQNILTEHKKECERCKQKLQLPSTTLIGKSCDNSNDCVKSELEKAQAYLNKVISEHNTSCKRCKQKQSNAKNNSNNTITLENMLEQAWKYFRKLGSGHNNCIEHFNRTEEPFICLSLSATESERKCCQRYQQMAKILCFKYSTSIEMDKSTSLSCKGQSNEPIIIAGNLGLRSGCTTCYCPGCKSCPAENIPHNSKSCPSLCKNDEEEPEEQADEPDEETEDCEEEDKEGEQSHEHCCHVPPPTCCHHPAPSCYYSPRDDHLKLSKSMESLDSFHSNLCDPNDSPCIGPCKKLSGLSQKACEILGIPKECCTADKSKDSKVSTIKKSGISLTKEPKDHKFCSRPDCVHSKQNLSNSTSEPKTCPPDPANCTKPPTCPAEPPKCPAEPPKCPAEPPKCPAEPPKCPAEPPKCPAEPPKCPGVLSKCPTDPPKCPGDLPKCPGLAPISPGELQNCCTSEPCTAACSKEDGCRQPCCCKEPEPPPCLPPKMCHATCTGACSKSDSTITMSMYQEQRPAATELDVLLKEFTAKEMKDKETICETNCDCLTCIGKLLPKETDKKKSKIKADPHNYRYYY